MLVVKFSASYNGLTTTGTITVDYAHETLNEIRTKIAAKIGQPVFGLTISL